MCSHSNVIYKLAKAIGSMHPNGLDSRLPAKRMPMGLLEYIANFYNVENYQHVSLHNINIHSDDGLEKEYLDELLW